MSDPLQGCCLHGLVQGRCLQCEANPPAVSGVTECCEVPIGGDRRFCPKCGWEARILSPLTDEELEDAAEAVAANAVVCSDPVRKNYWRGIATKLRGMKGQG
jgi:hypothetical protein